MFDYLNRSFNHRCYMGGKLHNFVARYSIKESISENISADIINGFIFDTEKVAFAKAHKENNQNYEGDVCTWCGKIVNTK